jgi:hypothetical protein
MEPKNRAKRIGKPGRVPYKIYLMLGFHASFHHSWRGDTPDEAGFGTDIRLVNGILRILDEANAAGQQARGYWDFDVYWTLQEIIPRYAPEIIDRVHRRVQAGLDEIVLGYYNNGANHAATEAELRVALRYARENPFGSGLKQLFGQVTDILRPQESMYTSGHNAILRDEGIGGLVLYYSGIPFTAFSSFIPALPPEQRYNPLWLRTRPDEIPLLVWPCISPGDLVENVCLEALLLKLRRLQTSGRVQTDLLVHINFDADSETWLPLKIPAAFSWFPNTGGLKEYISLVTRYPWLEWTVPSEYLAGHAPQGEVLVRQDLADGGFDGNYSWAEKYTSLQNWTLLEQSRLHTYRAEALLRQLPENTRQEFQRRLWEGPRSPFFQRLVGLTTTHFGMSTPVINEERQAKAEQVLGEARRQALAVEKEAASLYRRKQAVTSAVLYTVDVLQPACPDLEQAGNARAMLRMPLILPAGVTSIQVEDDRHHPVKASWVDVQPLSADRQAGDLLIPANLPPGGQLRYRVFPAPERAPDLACEGVSGEPRDRLQNPWIDLRLSAETGIAGFYFAGQPVNLLELQPFITYRSRWRPRRWTPDRYSLEALPAERWSGLQRARLQARIPMETPFGRVVSRLQYTFTLFDELPFLLVDVRIEYASTPQVDNIHTIQQKLRRLLDLRWIETAPFQIHLHLKATPDQPLRVWKHNFLGVTAYYDLNYGQINPHNHNLDSFNHQVTAGWVAVSDGERGLLLAESADALASMAFCPMRLRLDDSGCQRIWLNPFGSYNGRQFDYSHLGGKGVGTDFARAVSGSLRPNGPSYNGQKLSFSLLLAPYSGDQPPAQIQADALAFFYPPGVVYVQTPTRALDRAVEVTLASDMRTNEIAAGAAQLAIQHSQQGKSHQPLPAPCALLANPGDQAVTLVWEAPDDPRVTGYTVRWRSTEAEDWVSQSVPCGSRWTVGGLSNRQRYIFQLCSRGEPGSHLCSSWIEANPIRPGAVLGGSLFSALPALPAWTLVRTVVANLAHVVKVKFSLRGKQE